MNKPGATHEGQLRPIGLLTYVYRTWIAIRRQTQKEWTQKLHGSTTPSAVELAWETKKNEELGKWQGEGSITAFLDCYERVSHDKAYNRMIQTGCRPKIANLVMDPYQGQRRIKVHGATSKILRAKAGIIAVCAFAKDVLKAVLEPIKEVMEAECRDYVDDITIIARGHDHKYVVPFFYTQLERAKNWLTQNNMALKEKKEQIYANNAKFKNNGKIPRLPR